MGNVCGKKPILTNDIAVALCTLNEAAKLLKANGAASVRAAVSYCLFTDKIYECLSKSNIDEFITTNSTGLSSNLRDRVNARILGVNELLSEAIVRIHNTSSVTDLFEVNGG
jgi:ribose-phosphate pyrophosphokinase